MMYNFGAQGPSGYSREIKKTQASRSGLYLNPQPFAEDVLLVCRVGDAFRFWTWDDGAWSPESYLPGVTANQAHAWPEIDVTGVEPMRFDLPLPATVQVGVMAGAWTTAGPADDSRTRAVIDYVRFAPTAPASFDDCTAGFPDP
ncbi:MAG: hypothetical protein H6704_23620 [Myxococcales bacterium]|nr:hypothetical protein [Myxococcales bacterium]